MRVGHNKITTPPKREQVKVWLEEKYTNFETKFLDDLVNKFFQTINEHTEYSKKKSIKYIQDNLLKWDRIYRKQEIGYWLNRGWSKSEAEAKRVVRNKDWYIKEYGEKEGIKRYNKKCQNISKNCGHTLERFIIRHGETEGKIRWDKYKLNCSRDLAFFIKKYGKEEGILRYNNFMDKAPLNGYTLEYCINKYGKEEGIKKYNEFKKKIAPTLNNFIRKYGKIDGLDKYNEFRRKTIPNIGEASKESLLVFKPLIKWMDGLVNTDNIYIGYNGGKEYFLRDNNDFFLYDLTILDINIIIEYNGIRWHANPNWDVNRLKEWYNPYSDETYKENIEKFEKKTSIALKNGFKVLTLWSDISVEENLEICKEFILRHINNYEK